MSAELTDLQKKLCEALQDSLPLCSRPFAELAAFLGTDEQTILNETLALRNCGVIRRLGPFIDYHALGRVSALVAGHVDENMLAEVVKLVNAQPGVSHNYLRGHHYNLWFTLQADSAGKIEQILTSLTAETGVTFHRLPAIRSFKLDVRFNLSGEKRPVRAALPRANVPAVELTARQKQVLSWLQNGIEIVSEPFSAGPPDTIEATGSLIQAGVIKRIAAALDYRRLGFTANAMFCCRVDAAQAEDAGTSLASLDIVSHCYERKTFPGWPFNLFAMLHARTMDHIETCASAFADSACVREYMLLPTLREFKKTTVRHDFTD